MRKRLVIVFAVVLMFISGSTSVVASTLNSGTLFRYPWISGELRVRTQGQQSVGDHNGNGLTYAVDWGLANQSTLLFAANAGTLVCHPQSRNEAAPGLGRTSRFTTALGAATSMIAHTVQGGGECYPYGPDNPTDASKISSSALATIRETRPATTYTSKLTPATMNCGALTCSLFTLSDHAPDSNGISFPDIASCTNSGINCVSDGPSDNAGTGYTSQNPVVTDQTIISTSSLGGSSGAWWNVGARVSEHL